MKNTINELLGIFSKNLTKPVPTKRKTVREKKAPFSEETILKDIHTSIKKSGCKSLTVGGLYRAFGHKRRGPKNTAEIVEFLKKNDLHSYPTLNSTLSWNSRIEIHQFQIKSRGKLYDSEKKLQKDLGEKKFLKKLNLDLIKAEHSPDRTRDRMDFFAKDGEKNVVIEVKNRDGGKRAVEQVLRYSGMLKQQHPETEVRKILITGIQDQHTAKAIHGMTDHEKTGFEWYLYNHDPQTGNIDLEKVDYNNLFQTEKPEDKTTSIDAKKT